MNAKSLAYEIHAASQQVAAGALKRAHIHELIAAAPGFRSHAAMLSDGVQCQLPPALARSMPLSLEETTRRAVDLGYDRKAGPAIAEVVCKTLETAAVRHFPFDLLLSLLLDGRTEVFAEDFEEQRDDKKDQEPDGESEDEVWDEATWEAQERERLAACMELRDAPLVAALRDRLDGTDGRVHLASALLLSDSEDIGEFDPLSSIAGQYWHAQQATGRTLEGVEREWADGYALESDPRHSIEQLISAAADLGQPDALLILARTSRDTRFFEQSRSGVYADPMHVAQLADSMGYHDAGVQWLEVAASQGNIYAMRELIPDRQPDDPLKCWTWHHLAMLFGKDVRKDDYHAIHENGEPYDDDVGGPLFAIGDDGIELPDADSALQEEARQLAVAIYSRDC